MIEALPHDQPREIRLDPDGEVDEVCVATPDFVHIERMDDDEWSVAITMQDGRKLILGLARTKKEVCCYVLADEADVPVKPYPVKE